MFNELMLNQSCWAHEGWNFDYVNDWGVICFKPGGFLIWKSSRPHINLLLLLYMILFTVYQIIDGNDDIEYIEWKHLKEHHDVWLL